jgi:hypothetical protein
MFVSVISNWLVEADRVDGIGVGSEKDVSRVLEQKINVLVRSLSVVELQNLLFERGGNVLKIEKKNDYRYGRLQALDGALMKERIYARAKLSYRSTPRS